MNKRKILIILILVLIIAGCTVKGNQEVFKTFETIESTIAMIGETNGRLIGSDGNYEFAEKLKEFIKKYENDNLRLGVQEYDYKILDGYRLTINSGDKELVLDEKNSYIALLDEKIKNTETVTFLNTDTVVEDEKKYISLSNFSNINSEIPESNIFLRIINRDVHKNQQVIKIGDITTAIYVEDEIEDKLNKFVGAEANISFEPRYGRYELENIYALIKGKDSSKVTVVTAHYDSLGGVDKKASKGVLDNGSGVAVVLDLVKYFSNYEKTPDTDLIFAFVNSEEVMSVTGGGSQILNSMLSENYKSILNINLDCLGQKGLKTIYYGFQGNVDDNFIAKELTDAFNNEYTLERVEHYTSDNLNFVNSIYIYNMDYGKKVNDHIHKDDDLNNIDIESLKSISAKITMFIDSICYENTDKLKEDEEFNEYDISFFIDPLKFGQYFFSKCIHTQCKSGIHFNVNSSGETIDNDIADYFEREKIFLFDIQGEYKINFQAVLPDLEYDGHEIDKVYKYFDEDKSLKDIVNEYELNKFSITVSNKNTVNYVVSVQKFNIELESVLPIIKDAALNVEGSVVKSVEVEDAEMYFIKDENSKWTNRIYSVYKNDNDYYEIQIYSNLFNEEVSNDTIINFCDNLVKYSVDRMK